MKTFRDLSLDQLFINVLDKLGYTTPTEIQAQAIPLLLAKNTIDFHGQAQTGTGKTLAFGLPMLQHIDATKKSPQALIMAPTRELVVQICQSLEAFAKTKNIVIAPVYGGVSFEQQRRILKQGSHVIVGTPGRLVDHYNRKTLTLSGIKTIILDEADIMLDMGFRDELDIILKALPGDRNIWLFSATIKEGINELLTTHMKNTVSVSVSKKDVTNSTTKQYYCTIPAKLRLEALTKILESTPDFFGFIFCQTKIGTGELAQELIKRGYKAAALHGDLSQDQRNKIIRDFKAGLFSVLVATDVAARGIDIPDITHVINYSFPDDHESYVHRIGRTGRAGKEGIAITFISSSQNYLIKQIEKKYKMQVNSLTLPTRSEILAARTKKALAHIESLFTASTHLPKETAELSAALEKYSSNQLSTALINLLQEKFFSHIPEQDLHNNNTMKESSHSSMIELSLNIGSDDGIFKKDILDHISQESSLSLKDIGNIKVIKRRTFVIIPSKLTEEFSACFNQKYLGGRRVQVYKTEQEPRPARDRGRSGRW